MARTVAGRALTEQHRRMLQGLNAATIKDLIKLWPLWNPDDPNTYAAFAEAVNLLVSGRRRMAAGLAARYYQAFRLAEDVPGEIAVMLADALPQEAVQKSLDATARAGFMRALQAGLGRDKALNNALVRASGSVVRMVGDGSRDTILGTVGQDRWALGYCRVTGPKACAFCAMLASRGPVYKTGAQPPGDHDHGNCTYEPFYSGSEWPPRSREFKELWDQTKHDTSTTPLNAFRRALEGREAPA